MTEFLKNVGSVGIYKRPKTEIGELSFEAIEYLTKKRALTRDSLKAYRVGCTARGAIAIPFYDHNDRRQLVKFRHASGGMLKLHGGNPGERKVKTFIEPGGRPILLGSHMAHYSAGALVISFGDYDAMSIYQAGVPNSCSVPFGDHGKDWIREQWDFLQNFEEIILWPDGDNFSNEEAKSKAAANLEEIAARLGKHRVKIVGVGTRTMGAKDANDLLVSHGTDAIRSAVETADWFPENNLIRVADWIDEEFVPGRTTGYKFLDTNAGGFGDGHLILIGGDNAAGKTTLALNLIAASIEQRIPVLYWSGEQRVGRIRYWFERIAAGPDHLKKVTARETGFKLYFPTEEVQPFIRDWYRDEFYQYNDFFVEQDKFFEVAELGVRRYGCKLIVIDNLMAFTGGEGDNYLQAQGDFTQSCKMFAEKWNVTVALIVHNRKGQGKAPTAIEVPTKDDIEGSKKITNWADLILQLYRIPREFRTGEFEEADGLISIAKCRESGMLGKVRMMIDLPSNRIVELSDRGKLSAKFRWHEKFARREALL